MILVIFKMQFVVKIEFILKFLIDLLLFVLLFGKWNVCF